VSKTDPVHQDCTLTLGQGRAPLCPIDSILNYLDIRGGSPSPMFVRSNGAPLTRMFSRYAFIAYCSRLVLLHGHFASHSLLLLPLSPPLAFCCFFLFFFLGGGVFFLVQYLCDSFYRSFINYILYCEFSLTSAGGLPWKICHTKFLLLP
jgi:hypothetical protein